MGIVKGSLWDAMREYFAVDEDLLEIARVSWDESREERALYAVRASFNQIRVLAALTRANFDEAALSGSAGYGYGDRGRQKLEEAWREVFGAEQALVRPQIATGTQALVLCLGALLRPGDGLLTWPGAPYDTLRHALSSFREWGIKVTAAQDGKEVALRSDAVLAVADAVVDAMADAIEPRTAVVLIQRSRGYAWRKALTLERIAEAVAAVKACSPRIVVVVDNCYGEFVEEREPCHVGADLCAGSLMKNPGGALAPTGGYITGRADLVRRVAERLYAPGQGAEVGPTGPWLRLAVQGLFLAPTAVGQAMQTAVFASHFFGRLGFAVEPAPGETRGDAVQSICLGTRERLRSFCRGLQKAGPLEPNVRPEAWNMPGYADRVIMAGGTFVPGASLELGADAPLRPPFVAYLQGGVETAHGVLGCLLAATQMKNDGLLPGEGGSSLEEW